MTPSPIKKKEKKRYYPCRACKGKGRFLEDVIDVWPVYLDCGNCEGEGMIEVGGRIHIKNKTFRLGLAHLTENKDYSYDEIMNIGRKYL